MVKGEQQKHKMQGSLTTHYGNWIKNFKNQSQYQGKGNAKMESTLGFGRNRLSVNIIPQNYQSSS